MNRLFLTGTVLMLLVSSAEAFFVGFGSANAVEEGIKRGQELRKIPAVLAPTDLQIEVVSSSRINISWNDRSKDELIFEVERKQAGGFFMQIASVEANRTYYQDSGLSPNTVYCYRVRAYNQHGFSEYSQEVCAQTWREATTPAATPSRTGSATVTLTPIAAAGTPVATRTATPLVAFSATPTKSATLTLVPSSTATRTLTATWTQTASLTPTETPSFTPTEVLTETPTATDTATPTATP